MFQSLKTLKDLEKNIPSQSASGTKKFFTISSGETFKIRFRQELTEDSKNFDEQIGTAIPVPVVTSPINWKWRAASTSGLEKFNYRCWASEQVTKDGRWRPKAHLLMNVAIETEPGTWEPRIIDTTFNQRHIGLILIEYAKEFGSITDRYYKYSRTGSGAQDTNYTLIPLDQSPMPDNIKSLPVHDLNSVYMTLPYAKQEAFFTTGEVAKDSW
jgi:hypothetical protein